MFLPLYDDNPVLRISGAWVNRALIVTNIVIFAVFQSGYFYAASLADVANAGFGMVPLVLFDRPEWWSEFEIAPVWLTPLTSAFLHGGWMHLIGNMLFLWVFGDNVEDALGHVRYILFYCVGAYAAAMTHALVLPTSNSPLIGASGAVSAVVAAYVMLHPRVKMWALLLMRIPVRIPALWVIGGWAATQVFSALTASSEDETAWWAHIGGLIAGAILLLLLKPTDVPLFGRRNIDVDTPTTPS